VVAVDLLLYRRLALGTYTAEGKKITSRIKSQIRAGLRYASKRYLGNEVYSRERHVVYHIITSSKIVSKISTF